MALYFSRIATERLKRPRHFLPDGRSPYNIQGCHLRPHQAFYILAIHIPKGFSKSNQIAERAKGGIIGADTKTRV
jgi:hypothetical protein